VQVYDETQEGKLGLPGKKREGEAKGAGKKAGNVRGEK